MHYTIFLQWGLFDKQFGRSDAEQPDPEGRVLDWEKASVVEMKNKFSALGFGPRQVNNHPHALCSSAFTSISDEYSTQEILQNVMLSN